jgi:hypothetical protein
MRAAPLPLLGLFFLAGLCLAGTPEVVKELQVYYEQPTKMPPYEDAIGRLASADVRQREEASDWLVAILDQSLRDEKSGAAPWRATPGWGSSGENPAREVRKAIAYAFAKREETPPMAIPALRCVHRSCGGASLPA